VKKLVCAFVAALLLFSGPAWGKNLYELFKDKPIINVYLNKVENLTGEDNFNESEFKKIFGEALRKRINIQFSLVDKKEDADVVIDALVKDYVFREKVLPRMFSVASLAADTATPKSLTKLVVDYNIFDQEEGKLLMSFANFTTEERFPVQFMQGENAPIASLKGNVDRFVYRAFYKEKDKRDRT